MTKTNNIQATILTECMEGCIPVTMFLVNGFQIRGVILNFDPEIVVLVTEGRQQMIYKHAISTIVPTRPLKALCF